MSVAKKPTENIDVADMPWLEDAAKLQESNPQPQRDLMSIHQEISRSRGSFRSKCEELATSKRRLICLTLMLLAIAITIVSMRRPDLPLLPWWYILAAFASLAAVAIYAFSIAMNRPELTHAKHSAVAATAFFGITLSCVVALLPQPYPEVLQAPSTFTFQEFGCTVGGLFFSIPVFFIARIFQPRSGAILLGLGAGLTGQVVAALHCPLHGWVHSLLAHSTVLMGALIVGLIAKGYSLLRR